MNFNENAKYTIKNIKENYYHNIHKKQALEALEEIEKASNYTLTSNQKKECDEYALEVLGSKKYSPWLYVYTAFNQEFKEGWIPDNYFGLVVAPKINNQLGKLATIKTLTRKMLNSDLVPDVAYKINDIFYDKDYNYIPLEELETYLFSMNDKYYVKLDESDKSRGVFLINKDTFNINELLEIGNFVIQEPILQNPWFNNINESQGTTIRITTMRTNDNKVKTRAATLRVGLGQSSIVKPADSIRIPITVENGALGSFGTDFHWRKYERHPNSEFVFKGEEIPSFEFVKKEIESLHEKFIHYSIIGWDLSIDKENKPKIIEWNASHPGIKLHEAFVGPCFSDLGWEDLWK